MADGRYRRRYAVDTYTRIQNAAGFDHSVNEVIIIVKVQEKKRIKRNDDHVNSLSIDVQA